jgi:hypothetical protein
MLLINIPVFRQVRNTTKEVPTIKTAVPNYEQLCGPYLSNTWIKTLCD